MLLSVDEDASSTKDHIRLPLPLSLYLHLYLPLYLRLCVFICICVFVFVFVYQNFDVLCVDEDTSSPASTIYASPCLAPWLDCIVLRFGNDSRRTGREGGVEGGIGI